MNIKTGKKRSSWKANIHAKRIDANTIDLMSAIKIAKIWRRRKEEAYGKDETRTHGSLTNWTPRQAIKIKTNQKKNNNNMKRKREKNGEEQHTRTAVQCKHIHSLSHRHTKWYCDIAQDSELFSAKKNCCFFIHYICILIS